MNNDDILGLGLNTPSYSSNSDLFSRSGQLNGNTKVPSTFKYSGSDAGSSDIGMNLGTANTVLSGVVAAGNIYNTYQQNEIAEETLAWNKEAFTKKFDLYKKDRARKIRREDSISRQLTAANSNADTVFNRTRTKAPKSPTTAGA